MSADPCIQVTRSWRTDGGVARRWHHSVDCGYCHGTGVYSYNAACACGHWADECPEVKDEATATPALPDRKAPDFQQIALFELESTS